MTQVRKRAVAAPATPRQASRRRAKVDALLDPVLFKAFGDRTRASILACLVKCGRACSVSEVAECCEVDLSVVSRHLSLLARAGILDPSRTGRTVSYEVRSEEICRRLRALADAIEEWRPQAGSGGCGKECRCGDDE
ncbi:MAG: winged helix-turn-helix transcriptional regulator [Phycisphaerales bacterium]|nr:winged helix-turn-helix transcriptional regulator [Phycisphaerales bacterium]